MFEHLNHQIGNAEAIPINKDTGLAIMYNPTSDTAYEHAKALREYANYIWPQKDGKLRIVYLESGPTVEANMEILQALEAEGDFHYSIHGGDGTYHNVLLAAHQIEAKGVFVTAADGNACDLASSLHTKIFKRSPIEALIFGKTGKIHPIDISIETLAGENQHYQAISYAGVGFSGLVAYAINDPSHRKKVAGLNRLDRFSEEFKLVWNLSKQAQPFEASVYGDRPHPIIEFDYIGIDHMAKLPFGSSSNVLSRQAMIGELKSSNPKDLITGVGKAALGLSKVNPEIPTAITVCYENQDLFLMHIDGDYIFVPNGSTVSFQKSPYAEANVAYTKPLPR